VEILQAPNDEDQKALHVAHRVAVQRCRLPASRGRTRSLEPTLLIPAALRSAGVKTTEDLAAKLPAINHSDAVSASWIPQKQFDGRMLQQAAPGPPAEGLFSKIGVETSQSNVVVAASHGIGRDALLSAVRCVEGPV
jgi:hypothetical protein